MSLTENDNYRFVGLSPCPEAVSDLQYALLIAPYAPRDAFFIDGSVRTGKTTFAMMGLVDYAMENFNDTDFAVCGRSVASVTRSIIRPYMSIKLNTEKYTIRHNKSEHYLTISNGNITNRFYIFGGSNSSSFEIIQGLTLGGALIDEVVLLEESFVDQCLSRTSVKGAKVFLTCNPGPKTSWVYKRFVSNEEAYKNKHFRLMHLHITLDDNPGLDGTVKKRLEESFPPGSIHHTWYVKGEWAQASGLVFDNWTDDNLTDKLQEPSSSARYFLSVDYGITNPFAALLIRMEQDGSVLVEKELYLDGRAGNRFTDQQLYEAMDRLAGDKAIEKVIVDPSASSFIEQIRSASKYNYQRANNSVLDGIQGLYAAVSTRRVKAYTPGTQHLLEELRLYEWDERSGGKEAVVKENDHAVDALRYFFHTVWRREYGSQS